MQAWTSELLHVNISTDKSKFHRQVIELEKMWLDTPIPHLWRKFLYLQTSHKFTIPSDCTAFTVAE